MPAMAAFNGSPSRSRLVRGSPSARVLRQGAKPVISRRRVVPAAAAGAGGVRQVTEAEWEAEVEKHAGPVLVYFWATWCGPCKLMATIATWAAEEFPALKVVKVETDPNPNLTEKFDVYGLPTLYVFKDGEPVDEKWEGIITKDKLKGWLDERGAL